MFGVARFVVRHKVGVVAVLAIGAFFLTPDQQDEPVQSSNPWSVQDAPVQVAQVDEVSFVDDIVDEAVTYLDDAGLNPVEKADEAVGRFDDTASAYNRVNAGS